MLKEHGDKIGEADKAPIAGGGREGQGGRRAATTSTAIKPAIGELEQAAHAMAQHLYSAGAAAGAAPAADGRPAAATARAARTT